MFLSDSSILVVFLPPAVDVINGHYFKFFIPRKPILHWGAVTIIGYTFIQFQDCQEKKDQNSQSERLAKLYNNH